MKELLGQLIEQEFEDAFEPVRDDEICRRSHDKIVQAFGDSLKYVKRDFFLKIVDMFDNLDVINEITMDAELEKKLEKLVSF